MRINRYPVALLLVALLVCGSALRTAAAASAERQAYSATVSGTNGAQVQKVGFRAMILKRAIEYNLAGIAKNNPDGTVQFSLQGSETRIEKVVEKISEGTGKSGPNVKVSPTAAAVVPNLNTFTVMGWTSNSRQITNQYDLVFTLRHDDTTISKDEAEDVFCKILRTTLKGEDLKKLKKEPRC